jgi:L,D-transpeptidase ErfK/SrfK
MIQPESEEREVEEEPELSPSVAWGRSPLEAACSVFVLALAFTMVGARRPSEGRLGPRPALVREAQPLPVSKVKADSDVGILVGEFKEVTVQPGESLLHIARIHNTDKVSLLRLNRLKNERLVPGQRLLLSTVHIVPFAPTEGIVLNIPERGVYLFRDGRLQGRYPVAVGARTWETPVGTFKLVRKVINPAWLPPKVMVEREGIPKFRVPPGKTNPLGDRWMGWSAPEVGFHSTPQVETVGEYASHACVRLYPESAHTLFDGVRLGMPIYAIYEPIVVGRKGENYYLSVSPDIYGRKPISFSGVQHHLKQAGLLSGIDWDKVKAVTQAQDGFPHPIGHL